MYCDDINFKRDEPLISEITFDELKKLEDYETTRGGFGTLQIKADYVFDHPKVPYKGPSGLPDTVEVI